MTIQIGDAASNPFLTDVVQQVQSIGSLNAAVTAQLRGQTTATVQVTAIGSQTLSFQGSTDGVNFYALNAFPIAGGVPVTTTTTTGQWICNVAGMFQFRVICTAYTSGSATTSVICAQGENAQAVLGSATVFVGTTVGVASSAGVLKVGIAGGAAGAAIDGAIAAAPPANALQIGVKAASANPANATAGNQAAVMADLAGRVIVTPVNARGLIKGQATTISATGATTIITAGAAGVFNDITQLVITTAGLAAQTITISDGTLSWIIDYPNAAVAPGAPLSITFDPPLSATTAATAWTANQSVATACHYLAVFAQRL